MNVRLGLLLLFSIAFGAGPTFAQTAAAPQPPVVRVPDGGVGGRMESIFIPPRAGAPFSLTLATEWSRPLGTSGGTFTLANERRIVRDSKGRIYQERWILVPKGGKVKSFMDVFQITDPEQHTWYNCITATKVCDLYKYSRTTTEDYQPAILPSGPLPDGSGVRQSDDLGMGSTEGIDTHGYRETTTYNVGVMGNDQPMISTREFWYSPQLAINLVSLVDNPQTGKQVFTVKDLTTSEPEPTFFAVPEGYKVVDRRQE